MRYLILALSFYSSFSFGLTVPNSKYFILLNECQMIGTLSEHESIISTESFSAFSMECSISNNGFSKCLNYSQNTYSDFLHEANNPITLENKSIAKIIIDDKKHFASYMDSFYKEKLIMIRFCRGFAFSEKQLNSFSKINLDLGLDFIIDQELL